MKKKKTKHRIYLILIGILAFFSAITLFIIAILQSDTFHDKTKNYVLNYLRKNNLPIEIGSIEGIPPFFWKIKNLSIAVDRQIIVIDEISLRISFLALAKKEISLRKCLIKNVFIKTLKNIENQAPKQITDQSDRPLSETIPFSPPLFNLSLKRFKIENLHLYDKEFNLTGNAFLEKKGHSFAINTKVYSQNFQEDLLHFKAKGSEKIKKGYFTLQVKKPGFYFLSTKLKEALQKETKITLFLKGDYRNVKSLIFEQKLPSALTGSLNGTIALKGLDSNVRGKLILNPDFSTELSNFYIKNKLLSAKGNFQLSSDFNLKNMQFDLNAYNLAILNQLYNIPVKGALKVFLQTEKEKLSLDLATKNLVIDRHPIKNLKGQIRSHIENSAISGKSSLRFLALEDNVLVNSRFVLNLPKENQYLELEKCTVSATSFNLASPKFIILPNGGMQGKADFSFTSLSSLERLFPNLILKSAGNLALNFEYANGKQNLNLGGSLKDYHINFLLGSKLTFSADLKDLFNNSVGNLKVFSKNLSFYDLTFDKFEAVSYSSKKHGWDFAISAQGNWRKPIKCNLVGFYAYNPQQKTSDVKIVNFSGETLGQSFYLKQQAFIAWQDLKHFSVSNFKFAMSRSYLDIDMQVNGQKNEVQIEAKDFPLDFLSFNPWKIKTHGFTSCNFNLKQTAFSISSNLKLNLDNATLASLSDEHPLKLHGDIFSKIENNLLKAECDLKSGKTGLLTLDLSLPLKIGKSLFYFDLREQKNLKAKLAYEGRAEDILDFFNLRNNRLEGNLFCQLILSKNLINPRLEGFVKLENGIFENYQSGSYFKNISADLNFKKSKLIIETLQGYDQQNKLVSATGYLSFNQLLNYPYSIKCHFDSARIVKSNFIEAKADGDMEIKGNSKKSLIRGKAIISYGLITIPEEIPIFIPDIPTTYVNEQQQIQTIKPKKKPYPINLDLDLIMPDNIFVKGRGIDAQLQGRVYLTGNLDDIVSDGRLKVIKGTFTFSDKTFDLINSSIIFPGIRGAFPELAITAQVEQSGVVINANLKGPLNAPQLYFTSSPSLPLGSIISLLLFGRDISGISAVQALQVATAISSLSESNNIIEASKKKLGIDRLAVITRSSEESEDPDQVAILVGKYITKRIMLAFSRGFDYGVSNIIVEVDMLKGIMFQFETMAQEQQNKYTLKWKHNY